MTTQELIELSLLDAVGLLEETEREAFDRAFQASAPAIQAQVRREQTRLSQIEMLLPDVAAPAHLRAMVIEAVRKAMAAEADAPAPLAFVPPMARSATVSRWWRAASLGLATAAAIFMVATVYLWNATLELRQNIQGDGMVEQLASQFGHAYVRDVLLHPDTKRAVFRPVAAGTRVEAAMWVNPGWKEGKEAVLVTAGLPPTDGRPYRLAVIDENDQVVEEIATIDPTGLVTPLKVPFDASRAAHLAVFAPGEGTRLGPMVSRGEIGL